MMTLSNVKQTSGGVMSGTKGEVPQPPKPPQVGRKVELKTLQVTGVSLLTLLVLLALLGLFGLTDARSFTSDAGISLEASYPTRLRYKTLGVIDVTVANEGGSRLEGVTVIFDRAYFDGFSNVSFTPSVSTVTSRGYEVEIPELAPGESRVVNVELQAERYWRNVGTVEVRSSEGGPAIELRTLNFP